MKTAPSIGLGAAIGVLLLLAAGCVDLGPGTASPTRLYVLAPLEAGEAGVWVTGSPIVKAAIAEALLESFRVTVPAIVAIVSVLLILAFRSIRAVLLPVLAIGIALTWTLALLAWLGRPLNVVTILMPPLVITLGLAYSMVATDALIALPHRCNPQPS